MATPVTMELRSSPVWTRSHSSVRSSATRIWSFWACAVVTKGCGSSATASPEEATSAATHSACSLFHSMVTSSPTVRPFFSSTYARPYSVVEPLPEERIVLPRRSSTLWTVSPSSQM